MKMVPALLLLGLMAVSSARGQLGSSCSTVTPGDNLQCCRTKVAEGTEDSWCSETYPELYPDGASCGTVTPGTEKECCQAKIDDGLRDSWCESNYPELYPVAESCGTVTSGYRRKCCRTKLQNGEEADEWCKTNYAELYNPPGSTCLSVTPSDFDKCCADKAAAGTADETCPAPPGSTCASVNPDDFDKCCADKAAESTADATCPSPPLAPGNYADYPYMAYIESPAAPEGVCGGSLVAPGYVLTAAQCVFKDGAAVDEADVKVWLDGKQYWVETVLVDTDNAQFAEFANPKSENSWDIAMLALTNNSDATYVALPLADVPANGEWINTSAWKDAGSNVETALIPAWDGCAPGWADEFCAGGSGFLQACPKDKGSPAMVSNTQVGLTSGPGCDGTTSNYGYFVKLADKAILQQITVWLNHRGTIGQDENIQNWLIEANSYLYER